jgi:hypothetical protein
MVDAGEAALGGEQMVATKVVEVFQCGRFAPNHGRVSISAEIAVVYFKGTVANVPDHRVGEAQNGLLLVVTLFVACIITQIVQEGTEEIF